MKKGKFLSYFLGIIALIGGIMSCSKKDLSTSTPTLDLSSTSTQLLDSIYLYATQLYYWYDKLPTFEKFNPTQYNTGSGTDEDKAMNEIFAFTRYPINPSTGNSYELNPIYPEEPKYSFLEEKDAQLNGSKSDVTELGIGNDIGVYGRIYLTDKTHGDSLLTYCMYYENGPAYNAGMRRGNSYIYQINGRKFSIGENSSDLTWVNSALNSNSVTFDYWDTLGVSHNVNLVKSIYSGNIIFADTVFNFGSKKIGYFGFLNFADPTVISTKLNTLFNNYISNGVTDLIVDLRYNGGGYVETSEDLANLIAPTTANGKIMFTEYYNSLLQNGKVTLTDPDGGKLYSSYNWSPDEYTYKFATTGANLNLPKVCFIVSQSTASASELLINNLKPFMDVKLIGTTFDYSSSTGVPTATTTYGKPVGFFPIPIGNYNVYIPEFESRNTNGTAVSYSGMSCDVTDWDDFTHDFGDRREDGIAQAINYLVNNTSITPTQYIGDKSSVMSGAGTAHSATLSKSLKFNTSENSITQFNIVNRKALFNSATLGMIETRSKK